MSHDSPAPLEAFRWRSLKTRVTLFALAIFAVSIWSLTYYASRVLRDEMQTLLGKQQLSAVTYVAAELNQRLEDQLRGLEEMGKLALPALQSGPAAMQAFLEQRALFKNLFSGGLIAYRLDGTAIAEVPVESGRVGINYMDIDTVAAALQEGRSTIGRPVMGKKLMAPVFGASVPIRDAHGKVIGALAGVTNLGKPNFFDVITNKSHATHGGSLLLVAPQYRLIVTASDKHRIMEALPAAGINPSIDRFIDGDEGAAIVTTPSGTEVLSAVKRLPVAGWYLALTLPSAEVFSPIQTIQQQMLVAATLLTLLTGSLGWWMLRRELLPMQTAARAIAALQNQATPMQPLPIARNDEVGDLIGGFNQLLRSLGQREDALRDSQDRLEFILQTNHTGGWDLDLNDGNVHRTAQLDRIFGYATMLPEWSYAIFLEHVLAEDRAEVDRLFRHAALTQTDWTFECRIRRSDGALRWIWAAGKHRRDETGAPRKMTGFVQDITERKLAEVRIQRLSHLYAALSQCSQAIVRSTSETELFKQICEDAVVFGEMKMAWIGLVDSESGAVKPVAAFGDALDYLADIRISVATDDPHGQGPTGTAIRTDQPFWCQDFLNDPRTAAWHER
ncbi:MAG: GAF domain-containing protein, partial [Proteobacteria bacterium]|nr:GAF domain-containing protein [Pseudomonadota bacterium]